jgi:hypothetical protein
VTDILDAIRLKGAATKDKNAFCTSQGDIKPSTCSARSAMSPRGLTCPPSSMQSMRVFGSGDRRAKGPRLDRVLKGPA